MKIVNFLSFFPTSTCVSFFIHFLYYLQLSNCVTKVGYHRKLEVEKNDMSENQAGSPRNQAKNHAGN